MPSPRRLRLIILAAVTTTILILFYTSRIDSGKEGLDADFYHKTLHAMDGRDAPPGSGSSGGGQVPVDRDADGDVDADDDAAALELRERLGLAEQKAKEQANGKAGLRPDPPSDVVGVGSSAEGQDKDKDGESGASNKGSGKSDEERVAESTLTSILKKSPVIIFSKTYCPYSKRAKGVLLEKYLITPSPYVVELDEHPLGSHIQDELQEKTGRRTVPNVLINGISIGGSDDIIEMDNGDKLMDKIRELGAKRVEISERLGDGKSSS